MPANSPCPVCGKPGRRAETTHPPTRRVERATPEAAPAYVCITPGCPKQASGEPYTATCSRPSNRRRSGP